MGVAGCGFVTFSTEEQARAAIEALSDKCVLGQSGKPLVVKFAEGLHQVSLPAGGGIWMAGWVGLAGRQGLGARP